MRGAILGNNPLRAETVWTPAQQARLAQLLDMLPEIVTGEDFERHADWLADTDVIFSTWNMLTLTSEQLDRMPKLKAVFYAAGTVKYFAEPLLERGIAVSSAWAANAVPVAEYTLAQILFSLKLGWQHLRQFRELMGPEAWEALPLPGVYDSTVGLVSLGMVGRKVCELLNPFRLRKLAYDPLLEDEAFRQMGTERVGLKQIFEMSDVVTLHAPWLPETEGMVNGELLSAMKPNATFINTSRGALVNEPEMIEVLRQRPDLTAVIDVTWPEPPERGSPLYEMENIIITPHIAGSLGRELLRMSDLMIDEFLAWQRNEPLRYPVTLGLMASIA